MLSQGRGPRGTGHRWQAWAASLPWSSSLPVPRSLALAPSRLKDLIHRIPVFLGDGMRTSKQLTETLCLSRLCSRVPRAVCSSPAAPPAYNEEAST